MAIETLVTLLFVAPLVGGGIWLYRRLSPYMFDRFPRPEKGPAVFAPVAVIVVSVLAILFSLTGGIVSIPATHIGVVENLVTGQFYTIGPGLHVWPFTPSVAPLVTRVSKYDLRRQIIEIGESPVAEKGVQADSNSPGRPIVFFHARGWANPNPEQIIELHRRYGSEYLDTWVERVWVSSLKGIQGSRPYDFVGNNRVEFQDTVERALQDQLMIEDGAQLVFVSQLAVVDFDFEPDINTFLQSVAEKEFLRQQSEQQIEINKKDQEAAKINAETDYLVKKRAAEAEQAKLIAEAEGNAQARKTLAEAEAYTIKVKYEAEANGIKLVQQALANSPQAYLDYQLNQRWNGQLPVNMFGGGVFPFVNVPFTTTTPVQTAAP